MIHDTETTLNEQNYDQERISQLQTELDTYLLQRKKYEDQNIYIGKEYEQYIGYLCAQRGYFVDFNGIKKQKQDAGIDIIAKSANHTLLIQCKCWSSERRINENVIDQLVGSKRYFAKENTIPEDTLTAVVVTSTIASTEAKKHAKLMGVVICEKIYLKKYPLIKGFLSSNGNNSELEYRLPFDEDYYNGFPYTYFYTVQEAEEAGYKRVAFNSAPISITTNLAHSKRTTAPTAQALDHIASETQLEKTIALQESPNTQGGHKGKGKPRAFVILFYVSYIFAILISIIVIYNTSAMVKGKLLSAVITGSVFGSLGFLAVVAIIMGVVRCVKELINCFK